MTPRVNVSAERKPQILAAAQDVFLQHGYQATHMKDIARAAGMSTGNLYRYFSSKLDIILALMDYFLSPSLQALEALQHAPGGCRARLEQAFLADFQKQDAHMPVLYHELIHLACEYPSVQERLDAYNQRYQALIGDILRQGVERGELRPDIHPAATAFMFQALYDGLMQNLLLFPHAADLPQTLQQSFTMLFEGAEINAS